MSDVVLLCELRHLSTSFSFSSFISPPLPHLCRLSRSLFVCCLPSPLQMLTNFQVARILVLSCWLLYVVASHEWSFDCLEEGARMVACSLISVHPSLYIRSFVVILRCFRKPTRLVFILNHYIVSGGGFIEFEIICDSFVFIGVILKLWISISQSWHSLLHIFFLVKKENRRIALKCLFSNCHRDH